MNRRGAGIQLLAIATTLYVSRYVSAAIYGSGTASWDNELFQSMLKYVGAMPQTLSLIAALAGIIYLAWGEIEELRKKSPSS
jgi:hypothetical protein